MNKPDVKKLILLNLPYVFAFYFADKIAAVFRLAPGTEFIDKLTNGFAVFGTAFANPLPSFHPVDLLVGLIAGALLKLAVYVKGKNRKKFRQGEEYGSARWGKPEDIKPYMDPEFSNNVILTQTEFLTMNSRPSGTSWIRRKPRARRSTRRKLRSRPRIGVWSCEQTRCEEARSSEPSVCLRLLLCG